MDGLYIERTGHRVPRNAMRMHAVQCRSTRQLVLLCRTAMDVDVNPLCYAFMFDTKLCSQSIDSAGLQVLWRTERVPYSTVQQLRACDPNMLLNKVLETKCKTKCHHQGGANRAMLHVTVPRVSWNVLVPFSCPSHTLQPFHSRSCSYFVSGTLSLSVGRTCRFVSIALNC